MTHREFISSLIRSVHAVGAAATLDEVRRTRSGLVEGESHDALAAYYVWAVDRLITAGLSDPAVHWHPLTEHLDLDRFVPSTVARPGELEQTEPRVLVDA